MSRPTLIFTLLLCVIAGFVASFAVGVYCGYWKSPGMKSYRLLKDSGMTDEEIAESSVKIHKHTKQYLESMNHSDMMSATVGVVTLKALKDDDLATVERMAIIQAMSFYNMRSNHDSKEDREINLLQRIEDLSLEFPKLKSKIEAAKKEN